MASFANADGVDLSAIQDELDLEHLVQQSQFSQSESLSDALAIPESEWLALPESSRSLGRDHGATWFRLKIDKVGSDIEHPLFLMLDYPHYDYIDVYLVQNNTVVDSFFTGDQRGFDSRPVNQRTYLFPLKSLKADGPADIYFRINTPGPLLIPFSLVTSEQAAVNDRNVSLGLGVY
ncbi:MAG: 7TM-DISM domain-containing protein, partial [Thalassolituus sp.]